ncbi:hypothetical protein CHE218_32320 [Microbacterium sp. che218]
MRENERERSLRSGDGDVTILDPLSVAGRGFGERRGHSHILIRAAIRKKSCDRLLQLAPAQRPVGPARA